eukprot:scaffold2895_cov284-Pinguiococcus_pyrenoidosus.AAC.3
MSSRKLGNLRSASVKLEVRWRFGRLSPPSGSASSEHFTITGSGIIVDRCRRRWASAAAGLRVPALKFCNRSAVRGTARLKFWKLAGAHRNWIGGSFRNGFNFARPQAGHATREKGEGRKRDPQASRYVALQHYYY